MTLRFFLSIALIAAACSAQVTVVPIPAKPAAPAVVTALPVAAAPAPAASSCASEPSQVFSVGGGVKGLGPAQPFGYYSMSQHIACGTYTTEITELVRMPGGTVGTSARAGVSKILWTVGTLDIGLVGDAGVAQGATGSASGAVSGRGFANLRFGKSPFGLVATGQLLNVAGSGQQGTFTIGVRFAK